MDPDKVGMMGIWNQAGEGGGVSYLKLAKLVLISLGYMRCNSSSLLLTSLGVRKRLRMDRLLES